MMPVNVKKEGWLEKQGGSVKSWKHRYFILEEDGTLSYYAKKPEGKSNLEPKGVLRVDDTCEITSVGKVGQRYFLRIRSSDSRTLLHNHTELLLSARDSPQLTAWVMCLKEVCLDDPEDTSSTSSDSDEPDSIFDRARGSTRMMAPDLPGDQERRMPNLTRGISSNFEDDGFILRPPRPSKARKDSIVPMKLSCQTCHRPVGGSHGIAFFVDGEPLCQDDYLKLIERVCVGCGEKLGDEADTIRALGGGFHPACFTCALCLSSIDKEAAHHEYTGRPYCTNCYQQKFGDLCSGCERPLLATDESGEEAQFVRTEHGTYHEDCFVCSECRQVLANRPCRFADGRFICEEDYNILFAHRCVGCKLTIESVSGVIEALGRYYHPDCFVCDHCHEPLAPESVFYVEDENIYCEADYNKFLAIRCEVCKEIIVDKVVSVDEKRYWHEDCFACAVCKTPLSPPFFEASDGALVCSEACAGQTGQDSTESVPKTRLRQPSLAPDSLWVDAALQREDTVGDNESTAHVSTESTLPDHGAAILLPADDYNAEGSGAEGDDSINRHKTVELSPEDMWKPSNSSEASLTPAVSVSGEGGVVVDGAELTKHRRVSSVSSAVVAGARRPSVGLSATGAAVVHKTPPSRPPSSSYPAVNLTPADIARGMNTTVEQVRRGSNSRRPSFTPPRRSSALPVSIEPIAENESGETSLRSCPKVTAENTTEGSEPSNDGVREQPTSVIAAHIPPPPATPVPVLDHISPASPPDTAPETASEATVTAAANSEPGMESGDLPDAPVIEPEPTTSQQTSTTTTTIPGSMPTLAADPPCSPVRTHVSDPNATTSTPTPKPNLAFSPQTAEPAISTEIVDDSKQESDEITPNLTTSTATDSVILLQPLPAPARGKPISIENLAQRLVGVPPSRLPSFLGIGLCPTLHHVDGHDGDDINSVVANWVSPPTRSAGIDTHPHGNSPMLPPTPPHGHSPQHPHQQSQCYTEMGHMLSISVSELRAHRPLRVHRLLAPQVMVVVSICDSEKWIHCGRTEVVMLTATHACNFAVNLWLKEEQVSNKDRLVRFRVYSVDENEADEEEDILSKKYLVGEAQVVVGQLLSAGNGTEGSGGSKNGLWKGTLTKGEVPKVGLLQVLVHSGERPEVGSTATNTSAYRVPRSSGQGDLLVRERLAESPYFFAIPWQSLRLYNQVECSALGFLEKRLMTDFVNEESKSELACRRAVLQEYSRLLSIFSNYSSYCCLKGVPLRHFKPASSCAEPDLSFMPVNLHIHEMTVWEDLGESQLHQALVSRCNLLEDRSRKYVLVTCGAPADHVSGFKHGGLDVLLKEDEDLGSNSAQLRRRLASVMSQALTILTTCFVYTLRLRLHDPLYLEQLMECGFLIFFESMLSTHGDELGMLEDSAGAIQRLQSAVIRFVELPEREDIVQAARLGGFSPLSSPCACDHFPGEWSVEVAGDVEDGMELLISLAPHHFSLLPKGLRDGDCVEVVPVLFTQGINELQNVATAQALAYQYDLNTTAEADLLRYCEWFEQFVRRKKGGTGYADLHSQILSEMKASLSDVLHKKNPPRKNFEVLWRAEDLALAVGGGTVHFCRSGKDRTSMGVTLEMARILARGHGIGDFDSVPFKHILHALRRRGVRRDNIFKNTGEFSYGFNPFQTHFLPRYYRPPKGTAGSIA
eukprot:Rmarinus@m.11031